MKFPTAMTALILGLCLLVSLCGCGADTTEDIAVSEPAATAAPVESIPHEPITVCISGHGDGFAALAELVAAQYPDIKLEFISYAGADSADYSLYTLKNGEIADIYLTQTIPDARDMSDRLLDLSGSACTQAYCGGILNSISADDAVYLLPVGVTVYGTVYNKTLMEENGWSVPTDLTSLQSLALAITDEGYTVGTAAVNDTGAAAALLTGYARCEWMSQSDGLRWEKNFLAGTTLTTGYDAWNSTLDYVQALIATGLLSPDGYGRDAQSLFDEVFAARGSVFYTGLYTPDSFTATDENGLPGDEYGLMPLLSEDGANNIYLFDAELYVGLSSSLTGQKLQDAMNVLSVLATEEGQDAMTEGSGTLDVLADAAVSEDDPLYDAYIAAQEGRIAPVCAAGWSAVIGNDDTAAQYFSAEAQQSEVLTAFDTAMDTYLNGEWFAKSDDTFTAEQTAALLGIALAQYEGADAAVITVGGENDHANGLPDENPGGVNCPIYAGTITQEETSVMLPGSDTYYSIVSLTGLEISALLSDGDFPAVCVLRDGSQLEDETWYNVVVIAGALDDGFIEAHSLSTSSAAIADVWSNFLQEQHIVGLDLLTTLGWNTVE